MNRLAQLLRPALCLAFLLAAPSIALAQQGGGGQCPAERISAASLSPDQPPLPVISAYSVNAISDPVAERTRGETAARVVGGDQVRGWLRIDITLSEPVAAGCVLPFSIVREGVSQAQLERPERDELLRGIHEIFDGPSVENGLLVSRGSPDFERALAAVANGTDKVAMELPIQAVSGLAPQTHRLLMVLGRSLANARPLQLTVDPLPAFNVVAVAAPVVGGTEVRLQVDQPTRLHLESRQMPVSWTVAPVGLGQFREINRTARAATASSLWSADFVPARSQTLFVGGTVAEPASGQIRVTFAGRTVSTPVTVLPGEVQCQPLFSTTVVSGGVDVTLTNGSSKACPRYTLRVIAPSGAAPASAPLAAATRVAVSPSVTRLATPSVLTGNGTPVASLTPTVARFRFPPAALASLTKISIDAEPLEATLPTVRIEVTLSGSELATMKQP